jgi:hypothetical protein
MSSCKGSKRKLPIVKCSRRKPGEKLKKKHLKRLRQQRRSEHYNTFIIIL